MPKEVGRDAVARWDAKRRAGLLAKTPLFGHLSPPALHDLAAAFLPRLARRVAFVFLAGEPHRLVMIAEDLATDDPTHSK